MNDPLKQVNPLELKEWLEREPDLCLIDVREPHEHEHFNIGGRLIPLGDIMKEAGSIPANIKVVLYCKLGIRSQIAIQRLQDRFGFSNLFNLKGGIESWKKEVR